MTYLRTQRSESRPQTRLPSSAATKTAERVVPNCVSDMPRSAFTASATGASSSLSATFTVETSMSTRTSRARYRLVYWRTITSLLPLMAPKGAGC